MSDKKSSFAKREEEILKFWQEKKIFEKSLKARERSPIFSFYDGPPFATGLPHYGHLVASLMKDVIPRYQTMRGKYVERRWGWDCHGLPIENIVEGDLGLKSKKDIQKIGIAKFNETCKSKVMTYRAEWRKTIDRFGRWADMDNDYKTMDLAYMESIWWVFKELWKKGLIYEDYKSMHICPRCETTLAQAEVTEGYRQVQDLSVIVKFELQDEPGTYLLAWTTTPWTLIGNVALAIGEKIKYVKFEIKNHPKYSSGKYIASKSYYDSINMGVVRKGNEKLVINQEIEEVGAKDLCGKKYKPLFDYYINQNLENKQNLYTIQTADFVSTEEGTGIVHIAPAFGEDDMQLGKEKNLPFIQHVNMDGTLKNEVKDLRGEEVKPKGDPVRTDKKIMEYLDSRGLLFKHEYYEHSYPYCWRCESPLLNYAASSYFVAVTKIKDRMLKLAKKISWVPEHIKVGRFGNWLEGARDWALSRQRFWGSVIPVWKCRGKKNQECKNIIVIGSVEELEKLSGKRVQDLHKHIIDNIEFPCQRCKGAMKRVPDVLDCWFESGSMPYAQAHYPFENKKKFEKSFPAEFIAEGVDQTIKWFYYLHVISSALKNSAAFHYVVVNGIVLAQDKKKMSKRLKNYPSPDEIFDRYGADAMRYYFVTSGVVKAEDLRFSEKEVLEIYRNVLMLLENILAFYKTHAGPPHIPPLVKGEKKEVPPLSKGGMGGGVAPSSILDQWILARLKELIGEITESLDSYELARAARPIEKFINDLSTWYLRRSRERFKEGDKEGIRVFGTALLELSKLMAPFMPFIAEYLYKEVTSYPPASPKFSFGGRGQLPVTSKKNKKFTTDNLQLTTNINIKESVHLEQWPEENKELRIKNQEEILKQMELTRKIVEMGLKRRMEAKIKVRQPLSELRITNYELGKEYSDLIKDELNVKEVIFIKGKEPNVELDTHPTHELQLEGQAREFIRQINNLRKMMRLTFQDRVDIVYSGDIDEIAENFRDEILKGTVSSSLKKGQGDTELEINRKKILVKLIKIDPQ